MFSTNFISIDLILLLLFKRYRQRRETFGDDPLFGVNFVVEKTGIIKRGDAIYVTLFK